VKCVVEAGNINKNKKKCSLDSLPRVGLSANLPLCREPSSRQVCLFVCLFAESLVVGSRQTYFFFENHLGRKYLFFLTILCRRSLSAKKFFADGSSRQRSSLPTVALGKEAVTPLAVIWPLLGRASLPRARVCREPCHYSR